MPYRLHATKRSLYKLAAEKIANLPWCELPKMSDVLFEHIRTSYWLRWPYHEVYFTTLIPGTPLLTVTQYDYAPSDDTKHQRNRRVFRFTIAELSERGIAKEISSCKTECVPMEHAD